MLKIAITGSTGLVGSRIIELLKDEFEFIPIRQEDGIDITNKDKLWQTLKEIDFDIFFHLAAYTNVDGAENNKDLVHKINVLGTKNVFEIAESKNKKIIYISTGFVFDGTNPPYDEDSLPNPLSYYAQTKYEGENIVKDKGIIVRIEYPYRKSFPLKNDFVHSVLSFLKQNKPIKMVDDILITPTFIDDIAYGMKHLFNNFSPETYHLVGSDSLSPYEAGKLTAQIFKLDENLIQPTTAEIYFQGKAPRPKNAVIKSKRNNFWKMKTLEEGLKEIY
jgi:dTDP-4-dehydrorhamnose reductase